MSGEIWEQEYAKPLTDGVTLAVWHEGTLLWSSKGRWLHPLFELEQYLLSFAGNRDELILHDTIQGRAAAALCVYLGIKHVRVDLISDGALSLYRREGVSDVSYREKTERIKCCTEVLIGANDTIPAIYTMLRKKANLTGGMRLSVSHASFSYPGHSVFSDVSFVLEKGDAYILEGENGSGKSTLISCILGLLRLSEGTVLFDGEEKMHDVAFVKQVQSVSPFPLSVSEVVRMAVKKGENVSEQVELALRRTGAYDLNDRNYFSLSGGETQKVNLARALAGKARLLILDEPTASLDKESKENVVTLLSSLRFSEMPTMLLVSHDQSVNDELSWPHFLLKDGHLA